MPTLRQLKKRAKVMGYKMTPTLEAELTMLAAIPDDEFAIAVERAKRKVVVEDMASKFQVAKHVMEWRLGYT